MVKKTCQSLESLNSDVRARSQAQITILGQDEQEKDAKNRTSRNSASELTNPLEMKKKHFCILNRSILMSELGVRPKLRFWAKMKRKKTRKIGHQEILLLSSRTLQKWQKKHVSHWNRSTLMSELGVRSKLRFWAKMRRKNTRKIRLQEIQLLSSRTPQKQ